jgi:hypothetical protein
MVDQVSTTSMMMAEQHKVQQINEASCPRERMKATCVDEDLPRLLQRSESMRILDHHQNPYPPPFRRQNSSVNYHHQHRDYQSNDSRNPSPRFINDNVRVGNNNSNNNNTPNPIFHEGSNRLPPRPPPRFSSYQPNSLPNYHSTAPMRTFQPNNNVIYPVEGSYPSSISSRDHGRPTLQRKASGLHGRPTLQRKDSGHHGRPTLQRRPSGLHGHHERPSLQRKDSGYRLAQPRQQYRRSNSLPMSSLENSSSRPQLNRSNSMMYRKGPAHPSVNNRGKSRAADSNSNKFSPQKSTSIHRRFDKQNEITDQDDNIWVERIIVNGISGRRTYFKSVYGNVIRKEPPTGAGAIIYLEDIIDERRQVKLPKQRSLQQQQQQPQVEIEQQQQQQQPQVEIQEQQQQIEILPSKKPSSFEKNDKEALSKTNEDESDGKIKQKQPKRRAGFFGFMTRKRKNKTKSNVK